jgi:hypothetical protein
MYHGNMNSGIHYRNLRVLGIVLYIPYLSPYNNDALVSVCASLTGEP